MASHMPTSPLLPFEKFLVGYNFKILTGRQLFTDGRKSSRNFPVATLDRSIFYASASSFFFPMNTSGCTKVMPPIFLSEAIITVTMKFTYIMGPCLTKLRLFFHKVFSIVNLHFPFLRKMPYAGSVKLFAEASELFMRAVFQLVVRETACSDFILPGAERMEVGGGGEF
jgi:hypothetical protein